LNACSTTFVGRFHEAFPTNSPALRTLHEHQTNATLTERSVDMKNEPISDDENRSLRRLAAGGFQLASSALALGAIGYGVDHWMGNAKPIVGMLGVLVGFSLGFYRLIVLATRGQ